jgi:NADPH:quinone reductase-like Zn-dependent oxidoreductase
MRVWEVRDGFGLEHMRQVEREDPIPGPGEVLLSMRAASLNYRDRLVVRGGYGPRFRLPLIPVSDGVGEVIAVGEGVTSPRPGERVAPIFFPTWLSGPPSPEKFRLSLGGDVDGVLAQRMCVPAQAVVGVPEHLTDEEAAALPCAGVTAWSAVIGQGRVGPADTVLVQGTGGVALFALQFAKLAGARVIVISSDDGKLQRTRELGCDVGINYRSTPDWDRAAKEITHGEGCDHVVELGGAGTLERSVRAARIGGTLSLIGVLAGAKADVPLPLVVMRNLRLQGVTVGSRDDFAAMARAIGRHRMRPVIDRTFDFDEAPAAFTHLEAQRHFGKVCIRIAG